MFGVPLNHTSRLSGVRRTVTPASTLPTVKETSMVKLVWGGVAARRVAVVVCRSWAWYEEVVSNRVPNFQRYV